MSVWLQIVIGWVVGAPMIAVLVGKMVAGADRALVRPALTVPHPGVVRSAGAPRATELTSTHLGLDPAHVVTPSASGAAA